MNCVAEADGTLKDVPGDCPGNYVFTPNVPVIYCKRLVWFTECVTVSCKNVQRPTFLAYGTLYRQYYAFCESSNSTAQIQKCPTNHVADVSGIAPKCNFVCPKEGIFASPNKNNFYFCYYDLGRLVFREQGCPAGYEFDQESSLCVLAPTTATPEVTPATQESSQPTPTPSSQGSTESTPATATQGTQDTPTPSSQGTGETSQQTSEVIQSTKSTQDDTATQSTGSTQVAGNNGY